MGEQGPVYPSLHGRLREAALLLWEDLRLRAGVGMGALYQWVTCCVTEPLWFVLGARTCCHCSCQASYHLHKFIIM